MKSEKEWIDNLRNQMEGYSEPLPEGLWDKLSKELEEPKVPKVIPLWKRWQVAAAVLVLLVSSLTYWFWSPLSRQPIWRRDWSCFRTRPKFG